MDFPFQDCLSCCFFIVKQDKQMNKEHLIRCVFIYLFHLSEQRLYAITGCIFNLKLVGIRVEERKNEWNKERKEDVENRKNEK